MERSGGWTLCEECGREIVSPREGFYGTLTMVWGNPVHSWGGCLGRFLDKHAIYPGLGIWEPKSGL